MKIHIVGAHWNGLGESSLFSIHNLSFLFFFFFFFFEKLKTHTLFVEKVIYVAVRKSISLESYGDRCLPKFGDYIIL